MFLFFCSRLRIKYDPTLPMKYESALPAETCRFLRRNSPTSVCSGQARLGGLPDVTNVYKAVKQLAIMLRTYHARRTQ